MGEIVATHAVIIFEMTDNWLDGGAALELSLHLFGDASLLAGGVDSEPVLGRGIVAAIAGISNNAIGYRRPISLAATSQPIGPICCGWLISRIFRPGPASSSSQFRLG